MSSLFLPELMEMKMKALEKQADFATAYEIQEDIDL
jgi:hypothetical protein